MMLIMVFDDNIELSFHYALNALHQRKQTENIYLVCCYIFNFFMTRCIIDLFRPKKIKVERLLFIILTFMLLSFLCVPY